MTDRAKDEVAAQVLAVIGARFERPGAEDTGDILDRARRLARARPPTPGDAPSRTSERAAVPAPVPGPSNPTRPAPDMRHVDHFLYASGALLLVVYFFRLTRASLHVYFTPDDLANLYRAWALSSGHLLKANLLFFLSSDFGRPMGSLWYRVIFAFAGFHPFWFHTSNLAILMANIWLTYSVARRLAQSREIAALSALAMAYQYRLGWLYFDTGFIYDVLCYFFLFAALALYLRVRRRAALPRSWEWTAFFVLYVCALDSKEMAVMLPAFLGIYELLYHPPITRQPAALYRWLRCEGRAALLTGAVAVVFVIGRSTGPLSLTHNPAYRPSFTWAQFMLTSRHFAGDFLTMPDWPAWAVVLLWTALAVIALAARSRVLCFAWLFLILSPLPIAFIAPRGPAQYYVPLFGWTVYASTLVSRTASFLTRDAALSEYWLTRLRGAALFVASMAILYSLFKPLGYAGITSASVEAPQNRITVTQLHAAAPSVRPGSRLLFLNDPIRPDWFNLTFMVQLSYGDPSLRVFRVKEMKYKPNDMDTENYDYIFDYHEGRFFKLKEPGPAGKSIGRG